MSDPIMAVSPRRMASPYPDFARANLEPIHQPLYSARGFATGVAIPVNNPFFNFAIGDAVPGGMAVAQVSTYLHTNMFTPNFLSSPKLFLVEGLRIIPITTLDQALTTVFDVSFNAGALAASSVAMQTALQFAHGTCVTFRVGTKNYIECPTWMLPANTGIVGTAGLGLEGPAGSYQRIVALHTSGEDYALRQFPILIAPQQNFAVNLQAPQPTAVTLAANVIVYAVLDGILGRETQ